jgi:hypothetical protein
VEKIGELVSIRGVIYEEINENGETKLRRYDEASKRWITLSFINDLERQKVALENLKERLLSLLLPGGRFVLERKKRQRVKS